MVVSMGSVDGGASVWRGSKCGVVQSFADGNRAIEAQQHVEQHSLSSLMLCLAWLKTSRGPMNCCRCQ